MSSQKGRRQSVIFAKKKFPVLVGTTSGLKKHLRVHPDLLEEYLLKQVDREKELAALRERRQPLEEELRALKTSAESWAACCHRSPEAGRRRRTGRDLLL